MNRKQYYALAMRHAREEGNRARIRKLIPKLIVRGLEILKEQSIMPLLVNRALDDFEKREGL